MAQEALHSVICIESTLTNYKVSGFLLVLKGLIKTTERFLLVSCWNGLDGVDLCELNDFKFEVYLTATKFQTMILIYFKLQYSTANCFNFFTLYFSSRLQMASGAQHCQPKAFARWSTLSSSWWWSSCRHGWRGTGYATGCTFSSRVRLLRKHTERLSSISRSSTPGTDVCMSTRATSSIGTFWVLYWLLTIEYCIFLCGEYMPICTQHVRVSTRTCCVHDVWMWSRSSLYESCV